MRIIALAFCLIALAAPSHAAQKAKALDVASMEKKCRAMVGSEEREGEGGRSHVGQLQVQRYSDCMMGVPRVR
jgi:hypothetical protein